jgi:hypothetical protein
MPVREMKLRTGFAEANIPPMKKILPILLLMLAGCANKGHKPYRGTAGFDEQSDWEEDKDFFYRTWYKPESETAQEKKENRDFFYGSWLHNE